MPRPLPVNPEPLFTEKPKKRKRHRHLRVTIPLGLWFLVSGVLCSGGVYLSETAPKTPTVQIGVTPTDTLSISSVYRVSGTVVRRDTHLPIPEASITFYGKNQDSLYFPLRDWLADENGYFEGEINSSFDTVEVYAPGCEGVTFTLVEFSIRPKPIQIPLNCQ